VENNKKPSALFKYSFLVVFILMTFGAMYWFIVSTMDLIEQVVTHSPSVVFDKGSFYLLGVSIGLCALLFAMIYEGLIKKELTETITKRVTRVALIGIGLMIILPQIAHYAVEDNMKSNGYMVCEPVSSSWLMYKHIVYVSNAETCVELFAEKEKNLSEPLF